MIFCASESRANKKIQKSLNFMYKQLRDSEQKNCMTQNKKGLPHG